MAIQLFLVKEWHGAWVQINFTLELLSIILVNQFVVCGAVFRQIKDISMGLQCVAQLGNLYLWDVDFIITQLCAPSLRLSGRFVDDAL